MDKDIYISNLKTIALKYYDSINDINLSKSLGFSFLKKYIESTKFDIDDIDILNSCVDASNDRGFDYIYIDDSYDDTIKVLILQSKLSLHDNIIDENEVSKYILNFNTFPNLDGRVNDKVKNAINQYRIYEKNSECKIEKVGIYVNLGKFTENALKQLESNGIEVYDFDRINNELFLSQYLPNFNVEFKNAPVCYNKKSFLAILKLKSFFNDIKIQKIIRNKSIFQYNVRGLMNYGKHSVAYDIKETVKNNPNKLFLLNNGITITCEGMNKISSRKYELIKASIVNGQQTINSILSIWGSIDDEIKKQLFIAVKVLILDSKSENFRQEVVNVARSTNKQNSIKESDLHSLDDEQDEIKRHSIYLPEPLSFQYEPKNTVEKINNMRSIAKNEAIVLINTFYNLNPSDNIETLFKNQYDKIFKKVKPEYISIILNLRNEIGRRQEEQDSRNKNRNANKNILWEENIYLQFKKHRTINYCLYLFSLILDKRFSFSDSDSKKNLIDKIYIKMNEISNYNISSYFSDDFWKAFMVSTKEFIKMLYEDKNILQDFFRKPLTENSKYNESTFLEGYDKFIDQETTSRDVDSKILI